MVEIVVSGVADLFEFHLHEEISCCIILLHPAGCDLNGQCMACVLLRQKYTGPEIRGLRSFSDWCVTILTRSRVFIMSGFS